MATTTRVTVGGRDVMLHTPKWKSNGVGLPFIMMQHGKGGDYQQIKQGTSFAGHPEFLADHGYAVGCISAGDLFNNATATGYFDSLYTYATGTLSAPTKIGVSGWSMGGGEMLYWTSQNLAKVACGMVFNPIADLDDTEANVFPTEIDAAYGGTHAGYLATGSARSPLNNAAAFRGGPKIQLVHTTDDPVLPYARTVAFRDAVNDASVSLLTAATGFGHQGGLINTTPRDSWEWFRTQWAA